VAAGITSAQLGPKHLDARQRISERANWHTLEFLLEGAVFLAMGLELSTLITDVYTEHDSLWLAMGMAGLAILVTLVVRGGYLAILLRGISARTSRKIKRSDTMKKTRETLRTRSQLVQQRLNQIESNLPDANQAESADQTGDAAQTVPDKNTTLMRPYERRRELMPGLPMSPGLDMSPEILARHPELKDRVEHIDPAVHARMRDRYERVRTHVKRYIADVNYLMHQPLGFKEGVLLTWAGMRGVVTLAAAQTLPLNSPHRSLLILIAFFVAAGSLVIQGGTLSFVVKKLGLAGQDSAGSDEWPRLKKELEEAGHKGVYFLADKTTGADPGSPHTGTWHTLDGKTVPENQVPLARIRAERHVLLELRSTGEYSSQTLSTALAELDAEEMSIQLRLSGED
jgi:CPA1 family monovalent cation:H+ antiporter